MCFFLTSAGRGDRESGGSRRTLKLVVLGEIEVEGYIHGLASPVGGEGGHFVDAGEGANAGVVHGTIAAGLRETNIFEGAVAENGESDDGVSDVRAADRRVDGVNRSQGPGANSLIARMKFRERSLNLHHHLAYSCGGRCLERRM